MEFKKNRVKQIITALENVRKSFEDLSKVEIDDIKHFYLLTAKDNLDMVQDYLESLADDRPENIDKLKADYNNLLGRYKGLQQRLNNIVEHSKESTTEGRFSPFSRSELNSIALALEAFNRDYKGIMNKSQYKKLMNEIKQQEEVFKNEVFKK